MSYQPNLIVLFWLLLIIILIVLPGLFKISCELFRLTAKGQRELDDVRVYEKNRQVTKTVERRRRPRLEIKGTVAKVNGSPDYCTGIVCNISKFGLCLKGLPKTVYKEVEKCKVVISTKAGNFNMYIQPRWHKFMESGYMIGAEIDDIPRDWKELILQAEQRIKTPSTG